MANPLIRMLIVLFGAAGIYIMAFNLFDADPLGFYGPESHAEKAYVEAQPKSGDLTTLDEKERAETIGKYRIIIEQYPETKAAKDAQEEIDNLNLYLELMQKQTTDKN